MQWDKEEFAKIEVLLLSADESNQLIGFELLKQADSVEQFAPLLTFLSLAEEDSPAIIETAKQILGTMTPETQNYWDKICKILDRKSQKTGNIKDFEKYEAIFDHYVKTAPRFSSTYQRLSRKLMNLYKNGIKGLEYMRKAADFNPEDYDANYDYAYYLDDSPENADIIIKCYMRCLKADDSYYGTYHNLGKAYASKGDFQSAIKIFREALAKFPDRTDGMIELSLALKEKGNISEARQLLELALEINANDHLALNNLAFLLWDSCQEYDLALKHIKKAVKLHPKHGLYWHTLAEVYWYGFKDKQKALDALHKGRKHDKSYEGGEEMIKELESI